MDKLNFFGFVPEIYVHGGLSKTTSSVNALFSMGFLVIAAWLLVYNSQIMFNKENPSTIKSDSFQLNPEMIPISPTTFNLGFGLEDGSYNLYKKESIYHLRAVYSIFERRFNNISGTVEVLHKDIPLETEDCTLNHFGEAGPQFADIQIKGLYCFKNNQPYIDKLEIGGKFISDTFKIIRIFVTPCVNGTSNVTCESPQVIESNLATTKFNILYTGLGITPENYNHPYVAFKDSKYYTTGLSFGTKLIFNPKPIEIVDTVGLFAKIDEHRTYYQLDFVTTDLSFKNFKYFLQFNIEPSQMKTIYKRNYMGLEDVLALVNGTLAVVFLIFNYMIKPYSKYLYFTKILNQLYDVRQEKAKEKSNDKSKGPLDLAGNYANMVLSPLAIEKNKSDEGGPSPEMKPNNSSKTDAINETTAPFKLQDDSFISKKDKDQSVMDESTSNIFQLQDHKDLYDEVKEELKSLENPQNPTFESREPNSENKIEVFLDKLPKTEEKEQKIQKSNTSPPNTKVDEILLPSLKPTISEQISSKKIPIIYEVDEESGFSALKNIQKTNSGNLEKTEMSRSDKTSSFKANSMRRSDSTSNRSGFGLIGLKKAKIPKVIDLTAGTQKLVPDDVISSDINEIDLEIKNPVLKKEWSVQEAIEEEKGVSEKVPEFPNKPGSEYLFNKGHIRESSASPVTLNMNEKGANASGNIDASEIKRIEFTFLDYLLSIFCKERIKGKISLLSHGERKIKQHLDIENIVNRLRDIEKIKMLLFDEEQMFLFDHLPRPELKQKDKSVVKPEEKYYLKLFHLKSNDPMKDSHGSATGDITPEINTKKSKNKGPDPKSIDLLKRKYFENLRKKGDKKGVDLKLINAYQKIFEQGVNPT